MKMILPLAAFSFCLLLVVSCGRYPAPIDNSPPVVITEQHWDNIVSLCRSCEETDCARRSCRRCYCDFPVSLKLVSKPIDDCYPAETCDLLKIGSLEISYPVAASYVNPPGRSFLITLYSEDKKLLAKSNPAVFTDGRAVLTLKARKNLDTPEKRRNTLDQAFIILLMRLDDGKITAYRPIGLEGTGDF